MKKILLMLISVLILAGCNTFLNTNPYYQTTYDSNCVYKGTTWSELVLCQQKDLENEWEQDKITNNLLDKDKSSNTL